MGSVGLSKVLTPLRDIYLALFNVLLPGIFKTGFPTFFLLATHFFIVLLLITHIF